MTSRAVGAPRQIVLKQPCAIYTRKSHEEGLEQEYNSLAAQFDAGCACIASHRAEGWVLGPNRYDDGGFSGGMMARPGLERLLADIRHGLVKIVVVYRIDRLTRSLIDFAKLMDVFEAHDVTFVSVTESFNTTTSAGRLMLNMLLSFAQFERELTGERIRHKFAASRARGLWMGGWAPFGYEVRDRKLLVIEADAERVVQIFTRFAVLGSVTLLVRELRHGGVLNARGKPFDKGLLYRLFNNRVYLGEAVHKGESYPGEHKAIVPQELWDRVHARMTESPRKRAAATRSQTPALLKGLIFTASGSAMSPTHTRRRGRLYRYYVAQDVLKRGEDSSIVCRMPAGEVEAAVVEQLRKLLLSPEIIVQTWMVARTEDPTITEREVREALIAFAPLWEQLFAPEQNRIVQLLVQRIVVHPDGVDITLHTHRLAGFAQEMRPVAANGKARP